MRRFVWRVRARGFGLGDGRGGGAATALLIALFLLAPARATEAAKASQRGHAAKTSTAAKPSASEAAAEAEKAEAPLERRPMVSKPTADEVAKIGAEGKKIAVIQMEKGTFRVELLDDEAPLTVANFVKLTRAGFYDGLTFHRVVKEPKPFIVQGGDPLGNGMGNPGYTIEGEFSLTKQHVEGTVAMARAADPNSAGSQFFICLAPAPHLDGQDAIFGQVIEGMSVVHQIAQGDVMKRVTIEWGRP
jgi:cyclophilin family peptidyl-prolyl cis-trans isomerase